MTDHSTQLDRARQDVLRRYAEAERADVARRFDEIVAGYEHAPVRAFIPVLAERELRRQLPLQA